MAGFQWSHDGEGYHTLRDEQERCIAQFGPNTYGMAGSGYTRIVVNDPATGKPIMNSLALRPDVEATKKQIEDMLTAREKPDLQGAANNPELDDGGACTTGAASSGLRLSAPVLLPLKFVARRHEIRDVDVCEVQERDGVLLATITPTPDGSLKIVSKYAVEAFEDGPPMPHPIPGQPPIRAFTVRLDKSVAAHASPV